MKGKRYLALLLAACMFFSLPALYEFGSIAEEQVSEAAPAESKPQEAPPAEKPESKPQEAPPVPKEEAPAPTQAPAATKAPQATPTPSPTPSPTPEAKPEEAATPAPEETQESVSTIAPEAQPTPGMPAETATPQPGPEEIQPTQMVSPEATPEPVPEITPEPGAQVTPEASVEATPEPLETVNPEASVEPTPSPTPEPPRFELLRKSTSYSNNHLDAGSLHIPGSGMPIPLLYQYDYGRAVCMVSGKEKSVASSGCGAASASMLIAYIAGEYDQTPYTLFYWAAKNHRYYGDGLDFATVKQMLSNYGVSSRLTGVSAEGILEALRANRPIIILMGPGTFTKGGHYIVLRGLDENGNVLVNDPNSSSRSGQSYPVEQIAREAKNGYMLVAYSRPEDADADAAEEAVLPEDASAGTEIAEENEAPAVTSDAREVVPELDTVVHALETEAVYTPAALETPAPTAEPVATAEPIVTAEPAAVRAPFAGSYDAYVSVDCVKLRTAPGTKGDVAALVDFNTKLRVVEEKQMDSGNVWCGVDYDGQTLYLLDKYLMTAEEAALAAETPAPAAEETPAPAAEAPAADPAPLNATEDGVFEGTYLAQVCEDRVNLRETPGKKSAVISSVPMGTTLCVLGEELCQEDGRVWCIVSWQKQKLYMRGDMLMKLS